MKLEFNFNQSSVIPYRKKEGEIEILLITSMKKKKWIIPKGYIEFNLSEFESAKKEAFEEAGVKGSNETIELGSYKVTKSGSVVTNKVYSMEVTKILEDYPEKDQRKRKWFPIKEAINVVEKKEISAMIAELDKKLNNFKKNNK